MARHFTINGDVPPECTGAVVAIGNFDGLHRGHQQLLAAARARARDLGAPWGMMTLEPHPRDLFRPDEPVFRLTPLPMKARLLKALGGGFVSVLPFSRQMAAMEARDFVRRYLVERMRVAHVVTGYDFHFGHGRKGDPGLMKTLGAKHGFGVTIVEQVADDDNAAPFASSSIRAHLRHGHLRAAANELGYWWMVQGQVVKGDRRGRAIGFPTANIRLPAGCEPREGIYAMRVRPASPQAARGLPAPAHPSGWHGAGYVGLRPTFDTHERFLEVYLPGFEGDLYGRELLVDFVDFIRPDEKFCSVDALVARMKDDVARIESRLHALRDGDPMRRFPLGAAQWEGRL